MDLTAKSDPPATPDKGTKLPASTAAAKPEIKPTVEQEIEALKNRIDELENQVKAAQTAALADSADTAALKAAEKSLAAGGAAVPTAAPTAATSASPGFSSSSAGQDAAAPPATAAPAPPEISAQTTTKGEPFPGDWTWLNSNGHRPIARWQPSTSRRSFAPTQTTPWITTTPRTTTLGGSTETFRSDEWQLEQISVGGDIHINNVRGRILTMDGLFATTTPRNDASPSRGQWDLAGAYKYVSEAWGGYHWDVSSRPQRRCRHLRLVHRPFQLLQLRQLDLSAIIRFLEHTLVLQRPSHSMVSHEEAEDRAVDHQRLAVLCTLQRQAWPGRTDSLAPHALPGFCLEQLRSG